ncbi:MAG: RNA polymerase sigma factor WhiG [Candidatus Abyssubacteria bacterium]
MKHDLASHKDISRLWTEYKTGEIPEAKNEIIVHYLSLVRIIAGRMALTSPPHIEEDDLIGWGVLGLMDAVQKFDPQQKASFETYASSRIRGAIIDQIRSLDWAPRSLRQKARRMTQAVSDLKDRLGRLPTDAELAAEMDMTDDELFQLQTDVHGAYILSLDSTTSTSTNDETEETAMSHVADDRNLSPDESASRKEIEERLAKAIEKLPVNERRVITLYYYDELTLKEIGEALGLSESRICQIHRAVMKKLKTILNLEVRDALS